MFRKSWIFILCLTLCFCSLTIVVHAQDEGEASEYDGTDYMVTQENNKASMSFPVPGTPMDGFFAERNYVRAFTVMPQPVGLTDHVGGQEQQIDGDSGFRFYLPTSLAGSPITEYAVTGFSARYVLTRDLLGDGRFEALLKEATQRHEAGESMGDWFTPPDSSFLSTYDLCIYMRFQDGVVRNITDSGVAMVGINLADAQNGNLELSYGAVAIDKNATDSAWHAEERIELGEEILSLIYDGSADGVLDVAWWIADTSSNAQAGGSSSGCNTSSPQVAGLILLVMSVVFIRRSKISFWNR